MDFGDHLRITGSALKNWAVAQAQDSLAVGSLWLVGLYILRVPWAPLWALLAAMLQVVPHLGPILRCPSGHPSLRPLCPEFSGRSGEYSSPHLCSWWCMRTKRGTKRKRSPPAAISSRGSLAIKSWRRDVFQEPCLLYQGELCYFENSPRGIGVFGRSTYSRFLSGFHSCFLAELIPGWFLTHIWEEDSRNFLGPEEHPSSRTISRMS